MPVIWNEQSLEDLRQIMDPGADAAIKSVYDSQSNDQLRNVLTELASNDTQALKEHFAGCAAPQPLFDLINDDFSQSFTAEDIRMFNRTFEIWKDYGIHFVYVLFFRALPFTYAAEKPDNVLRMTRLIEDQPVRRIFETAQFVFDVMDQNWWEPSKRGILTAVKIRIMHAAMRYMLLHNEAGEKWATDQWGMPISQEDMIATNQVFSLEFFKGMEILGEPFSAEDQEAWFHTWKVIGRIMGIQENLLLPTVPEAWDLQEKIYAHLFNDGNSSGIGLAKALVDTLSMFMLSTKLVLIIMYKMMQDDKYPDSFSLLLGPTYGAEYAVLFMKTSNAAEEKTKNDQINDAFFDELKNFIFAVKEYRNKEIQNLAANGGNMPPVAKNELTWLQKELKKAIDMLRDLDHEEKNLVDFQLETFDKMMTHLDDLPLILVIEEEIIKAKEEILKKAMTAIGAVIIDVLSKYFRPGKRAGFRIDANLKQHWAIH